MKGQTQKRENEHVDPAPIIYILLMVVFTLGILRLRAIAIRRDKK